MNVRFEVLMVVELLMVVFWVDHHLQDYTVSWLRTAESAY
jgi:hypothetical protein